MVLAEVKRIARRAGVAVAVTGLIAGPAFAFVAMGGGHGFHSGFHGGGFHPIVHVPAPPATVTAKAPFVSAPPPMHAANGGFFFHIDDRFHRHDRFDRRPTIGPRGEGFWGGGYGVYPTGYADQAYVAEAAAPAPVAAAQPCPELLTWSPKLGRATRQDLCGDASVHLTSGPMAGG